MNILMRSLCAVETVLFIFEGVREADCASVTISSQNESGKRDKGRPPFS